jgi:hypothetical protein
MNETEIMILMVHIRFEKFIGEIRDLELNSKITAYVNYLIGRLYDLCKKMSNITPSLNGYINGIKIYVK